MVTGAPGTRPAAGTVSAIDRTAPIPTGSRPARRTRPGARGGARPIPTGTRPARRPTRPARQCATLPAAA